MRQRVPKVKTIGERIAAIEKYSAQRKVPDMMADARANCPEANYWLALAYTGGLRTESVQSDLPLDAGKGVEYLRVCLRLGHEKGILHLAAMYTCTAPVPGYDPQKAAELTEQAAKCGSDIARSILQKCRDHGANLELLLSESVQLAWPSVARSLPRFTGSGFAAHPAMTKQFNLERSVWRTQRHEPAHWGIYEMMSNGKIEYAHWNGHSWTMNERAAPPDAEPSATAACALSHRVQPDDPVFWAGKHRCRTGQLVRIENCALGQVRPPALHHAVRKRVRPPTTR